MIPEIPEFDKLTHFFCQSCQKLLYRGNIRKHRFTKYHLKKLEKLEIIQKLQQI